jgi:hypothetical protein
VPILAEKAARALRGHPTATRSIHALPAKAYLEVEDGEEIEAGMLIAKSPREIKGTQDITGGLPRVTELFEARRPKEPAVLAEIEGQSSSSATSEAQQAHRHRAR